MSLMTLNHEAAAPASAGVAAMAKLTQAEKQFRHAKLVRFLDENDYSKMSVSQIAEAVGISHDPVRKELRAREGGRKPGRKPGVPHSPAEVSKRRARRQRATAEPFAADGVIRGYLDKNPGLVFTSSQLERATGVPHSTMQGALRRLGYTAAPGRGASVAGDATLPTDPGDMEAGGQDLDYVSKIASGDLVAIDRHTGLLWVMKPDRLL